MSLTYCGLPQEPGAVSPRGQYTTVVVVVVVTCVLVLAGLAPQAALSVVGSSTAMAVAALRRLARATCVAGQ